MHPVRPPPVTVQRLHAECDHLVATCLHSWSDQAVSQGIDALSRLAEAALLPLATPAGEGVITAREALAACADMHDLCRPEWRERELIAAVQQLRDRVVAALTHTCLEPA